MPTFGYTTAGASNTILTSVIRADIGAATRYTASSGDTITSFSVYGASSGVVNLAAYDFNGTLPVNRLAASVTATLGSAAGWASSAAVSQSLTGTTTYIVALGGASGTCTVYYDSGTGNQRSGSDVSGTLPDPWSHTTYSAAILSVYATYTAGSSDPALTGSTTTASTGTVSPGLSLATTGSSSTATAGAVTASLGLAVAGNSATATQGTVTPDISLALSGNSSTLTEGSVTASLPGVITLSSNSATVSAGLVSPSLSLETTGNSATATGGTVSPEVALALSGGTATASAGAVVADISLGLAGNAATFTAGAVAAPSGDLTASLTGNTSTFGAGVLGIASTGVGSYRDKNKGNKRPTRKILVTIKGARFLVPEDELDGWLEKQENEIVEQAATPVTVVAGKVQVARAAPKIVTSTASAIAAVDQTNQRIQQRLDEAMQRLEDDDEEELLLMFI